jgi:hypothetical protein
MSNSPKRQTRPISKYDLVLGEEQARVRPVPAHGGGGRVPPPAGGGAGHLDVLNIRLSL